MMKNICWVTCFLLSFHFLNAQKHTIGEFYGGGVVFAVNEDGSHGLIVETTDQSGSCDWNEAQIAVKQEKNHSEEGKKFTDWRLPVIDELQMLFTNLKVDKLCSSIAKICFNTEYYWSSSKYIYTNTETNEKGYDYAWFFKFGIGGADWTAMGNSVAVRAVREF